MSISAKVERMPSKSAGVMIGLVIVVVLAFLARWLKLQVYPLNLPLGIPGRALEYPLWAALVGLAANWLLKTTKTYDLVRNGFRTELFLKVGLVLLGTTISFKVIVTAAGGAVVQGLVLVTSVFFFSWWLSGKYNLPKTLRAVMSTAIAVCGVSAAIAAAGAVLAKKEEVTYITALVIITALPLMVIAPLLGSALGLPEPVAGAWFGGNIDTTAAVVGAGTMYGKTAQQIASIVKQTQNALIGVVAFLLALYFSLKSDDKSRRPSAGIIWQRFPKFVLGFIAASLLYTFGAIGKDAGAALAALKDWAFCLAFVSMGLDISIGEIKKMGWAPVSVYLIVTVFNTIVALLVAWVIFGWLLPIKL